MKLYSREQVDTYLNSWYEGDNITITADFLDMLESASKDLKVLELIAKHIKIQDGRIVLIQITQDDFNKDKQELIRIKEWLKENETYDIS